MSALAEQDQFQNELAAQLPERWDADEAQEAILLRFVRTYAHLDEEITAARAERFFRDDRPIRFVYDPEVGHLVRERTRPVEPAALDFLIERTWVVSTERGLNHDRPTDEAIAYREALDAALALLGIRR